MSVALFLSMRTQVQTHLYTTRIKILRASFSSLSPSLSSSLLLMRVGGKGLNTLRANKQNHPA